MLATDKDSFIWWSWVFDHLDEIQHRTLEHVQLTVIALAIGLVISVVLALVSLRFRPTYAPITWTAGVLYTIPSLALFAFFIPFTGLGFVTAEIGLITYTLLILVRSIVAGVDGVPASVKEAADGMGYTPFRRFVSVELPLALPVIVAGIRIAAVTTVGLVTVTALVGNGGYGVFITEGQRRTFSTEIVVGAVLSIALAVFLDGALLVLQRLLTPWSRRKAAA